MHENIRKETKYFGNDWGLFVDMESLNCIDIKNEEFIKKYKFKANKRFNQYNNYCQLIVDEYDFYIENNRKIKSNNSINNFKINNKINNKINIINFTSATCFSLVLTYILFYVL